MLVQGPVDSARLDARGQYRLRIPVVDSTANYLISVLHDGVGYFSEPIRPLHFVPGQGLNVDTLRVYDTSVDGPPLTVTKRLISVASAKGDGIVPAELLDKAQKAVANCPEYAVTLEEVQP